MRNLRIPGVTFNRVVGATAVVLLLTSGGAYAAGKITGKDIKDGTVSSVDIKDASLKGSDIKDGSIKSADVADESLTSVDLADDSVGADEIVSQGVSSGELADDAVSAAKIIDETITGADVQDGSLTGADVQDGSLAGDDVQDGSLTNRDVGAFFAQVNSDGSLFNASLPGASSEHLSTGIYEVDFGIDVSECGFSVSIGEGNVGSANPGQAGITDRSGNVQAAFVQTRDSAGSAADKPFQVLAVC